MSILKDVADGLALIASGIRDIKEIVDAVREGKDYIKVKHPEIKPQLQAMLEELRKTTSAIADASGVLTHFRFEADKQGEAARFNDYVVELNGKASDIEARIETLRGHCSIIRDAASEVVGKSLKGGVIKDLFSIFGLASPKREAELGVQLDRLAFEEHRSMNSAVRMVDCLTKSIRHVLDTLGTGGMMQPANIPTAAALLAEYATEFEKLEPPAKKAAAEIAQLAAELQ